jgi:DNA-binding NarL/FixJ family response regulator
MSITNWLTHTSDAELQHAAKEKIEQLQAVEDCIPGVIIVHNLANDSIVYVSERGRKHLHVTLEEIRMPHFDYHQRFFNQEDVPNYAPKILGMLQRNDDEEIVSYFQQVRATEKEPFRWFSSSSKILLRDKDNRPMLGITIAVPIDEEHYFTPKIERLIQENNLLREKQAVFAELSRREKEILRLLTLGLHSGEIADKLHIAEATIKTHRRNLRRKIGAESAFELVQFAQAFNLV